MTVDAIGVTSTQSSQSLASSSAISQQDFLNILLTQLRFQDPLKPVDNEAFVAQLAQFSALEINSEQSAKVDTLLSIEGSSQAIGLLGRTVQVDTANGPQVGTVLAVSIASGTPGLTIKTSSATLTDVSPSKINLVEPTQGN